jgi:hypothetical protein
VRSVSQRSFVPPKVKRTACAISSSPEGGHLQGGCLRRTSSAKSSIRATSRGCVCRQHQAAGSPAARMTAASSSLSLSNMASSSAGSGAAGEGWRGAAAGLRVRSRSRLRLRRCSCAASGHALWMCEASSGLRGSCSSSQAGGSGNCIAAAGDAVAASGCMGPGLRAGMSEPVCIASRT